MADFTLDFPPSLTVRIRYMHRNIHELNNYFLVMQKLHQETRIQSRQTLVELCRHKTDAAFASSVRQYIERFRMSVELEIKEFSLFCKDSFLQLSERTKSEISLIDQLDSVKELLRKAKTEDLIPNMSHSSMLARKLYQHYDQAKAISMDVQRMIRAFYHTIQSYQKQFTQIYEQINAANFATDYISEEYAQKMNCRVSSEVSGFYQTLLNIDLSRYEKDRILVYIADYTMTLCNEIITSCKETTDNEVNLKNSLNEYLPGVYKAVDDKDQLSDWLNARKAFYMAEIDRRIEEFRCAVGLFFEESRSTVEETLAYCQAQLDEHFTGDQYLAYLGEYITQVYNSWQNDIYNFKLIYIDGALETVKTKLVNTFEIKLTEDAANVLQHSEHFLAELVQMVQTWNYAQAERRLRQDEAIRSANDALRVLHGQTTDMMSDRTAQLASVGQQLSERLLGGFARMAKLMGSVEFRKLVSRKLDKARCDAAFTIVCPNEQYEENEFVDVTGLPKARLASEPLNAVVEGASRSRSLIDRNLNVHKVPSSVVRDDAFCKTEPLMSMLAFGQSRYNDSVRRQLYKETPAKPRLQRVPQVLDRATSSVYVEKEPIYSLELSTDAHQHHDYDGATKSKNELYLSQGTADGRPARAASVPVGQARRYIYIVRRYFPDRTGYPQRKKQFRRFKAAGREAQQPSAAAQAANDTGMHPYDPPLNRWGNRGLWRLGRQAEVDLDAYIQEYYRSML